MVSQKLSSKGYACREKCELAGNMPMTSMQKPVALSKEDQCGSASAGEISVSSLFAMVCTAFPNHDPS